MAMTACCQAQCLQASNFLPQGASSALEVRNRPATVSLTRIPAINVRALRQRGNIRLVVCAAEGSGSCCGGSSEGSTGSGKQSCSSHGSKAPPKGVAGVGAEFENMVSRSTMQEFEKDYDSGEMQGTISRDVVADVMNEIPELLSASSEEKFVDVDAVLSEVMGLANEDFVFEDELEGTMV